MNTLSINCLLTEILKSVDLGEKMQLHIKNKIYIGKDFALYKKNSNQFLDYEHTGKVLCYDHGFTQLLQISDLSFAVLTHIDTKKLDNQFEYTIVDFQDVYWLKNYIDSLKSVPVNSTDVLSIYEQSLVEVINEHIGFRRLGIDASIENPYLLTKAFDKFDAHIYKSIRINNIVDNVKNKIRIFSLIYSFYAKSRAPSLKTVHCKNGMSEIIGLGKPLKRGK